MLGANQNEINIASAKTWSRLHTVLQMYRIMWNLKGYKKKNFWRKGGTPIKKKKIVVVFTDFFLLYVYYDFTLFCFHIRTILYRNCTEERMTKESFYTSLEFSLFSVFSIQRLRETKFFMTLFLTKMQFKLPGICIHTGSI